MDRLQAIRTRRSKDFIKPIRETLKKDIGDWNAKIVTDALHEWHGIVGKYAIGTTYDGKKRFLEFTRQNKLICANTLHEHKCREEITR